MSAVDYLFEQLWELPKDKLTWYAVLKEAKEIHKEEIEEAFNVGSYCNHTNSILNSEEYYEETY